MLKKYWCLVVLLVVIVVGGVLFSRWYRYYHYSPVEGHTETSPGTRSSDDYDHCFVQSATNAVVVLADLPGIKKENVTLVDLNAMGRIDPAYPVVGRIVDPATEIAIATEDQSNGKTKITITDLPHFHLGPGPYMVVAGAPGTSAENRPGGPYGKLFYYYQTYDKSQNYGPDQCAAYRPDPGAIGIPTKMFIHGYTGSGDDLEHCFVRDEGSAKRPLLFDGYIDVPVKDSQIDLKLYTFEKGSPELVDMEKGTKDKGEWYVKYNSDKKFTIEIKKDARPHLGPGPYVAMIPILPTVATADASKFIGRYPYRTWRASSTPLDCYQ